MVVAVTAFFVTKCRFRLRLWLKATVNSAFYGVCNWQSVAIRRDYTKMYFIQLAGKPLSKDCGFLLINFNDCQKLVFNFKISSGLSLQPSTHFINFSISQNDFPFQISASSSASIHSLADALVTENTVLSVERLYISSLTLITFPSGLIRD